jgi:hypothetical protein
VAHAAGPLRGFNGRFSFCEWPVPASTGVCGAGPFPSSLVPFAFWAGLFGLRYSL